MFPSNHIFLIAMLLLLLPQHETQKHEVKIEKNLDNPDFVANCHACLVIDGSSSISEEKFSDMKTAVGSVMKKFNSLSIISIVQYGEYVQTRASGVGFDEYESVLNNLKQIGGSNTVDDIEDALKACGRLFSEESEKEYYFLYIITDGNNPNPSDLSKTIDTNEMFSVKVDVHIGKMPNANEELEVEEKKFLSTLFSLDGEWKDHENFVNDIGEKVQKVEKVKSIKMEPKFECGTGRFPTKDCIECEIEIFPVDEDSVSEVVINFKPDYFHFTNVTAVVGESRNVKLCPKLNEGIQKNLEKYPGYVKMEASKKTRVKLSANKAYVPVSSYECWFDYGLTFFPWGKSGIGKSCDLNTFVSVVNGRTIYPFYVGNDTKHWTKQVSIVKVSDEVDKGKANICETKLGDIPGIIPKEVGEQKFERFTELLLRGLLDSSFHVENYKKMSDKEFDEYYQKIIEKGVIQYEINVLIHYIDVDTMYEPGKSPKMLNRKIIYEDSLHRKIIEEYDLDIVIGYAFVKKWDGNVKAIDVDGQNLKLKDIIDFFKKEIGEKGEGIPDGTGFLLTTPYLEDITSPGEFTDPKIDVPYMSFLRKNEDNWVSLVKSKNRYDKLNKNIRQICLKDNWESSIVLMKSIMYKTLNVIGFIWMVCVYCFNFVLYWILLPILQYMFDKFPNACVLVCFNVILTFALARPMYIFVKWFGRLIRILPPLVNTDQTQLIIFERKVKKLYKISMIIFITILITISLVFIKELWVVQKIGESIRNNLNYEEDEL